MLSIFLIKKITNLGETRVYYITFIRLICLKLKNFNYSLRKIGTNKDCSTLIHCIFLKTIIYFTYLSFHCNQFHMLHFFNKRNSLKSNSRMNQHRFLLMPIPMTPLLRLMEFLRQYRCCHRKLSFDQSMLSPFLR